MNLYQCKICKKVCADGEDDPGDYETIDEHIVCNHPDKIKSFFYIYSLKAKDAR